MAENVTYKCREKTIWKENNSIKSIHNKLKNLLAEGVTIEYAYTCT